MRRQARASAAGRGAETPGRDALSLPATIRLHASGCRPALRTVDEALHMIDTELPAELSRLPRWAFARSLLIEAARTGRKRDLTAASRQVRQALSNEGWLIDNETDREWKAPRGRPQLCPSQSSRRRGCGKSIRRQAAPYQKSI